MTQIHSPDRRHRDAGDLGQASAELIGSALIATGLVALMLHAVIAGFALWSAASAARAGARAAHVGADPVAVAEAAVPGLFRPSAQARDGEVEVRVTAPALVPGVPGISFSATTAMSPAAGAS